MLAGRREELRAQASTENEELVALGVERDKLLGPIEDGRQELEGLAKRSDNLPTWCVKVRQTLCSALDIEATDLPFAGELIAVDSDSSEWESAIEVVLRRFALLRNRFVADHGNHPSPPTQATLRLRCGPP